MTTIYADFGSDGLPRGFYPDDIFPAIDGARNVKIPATVVVISAEQWQDVLANPGKRRWDGTQIVSYTPPVVPPTQADYASAVQAALDAKARERNYDSILSAVSYVDDPSPTYAAEAAALKSWRSAVWVYVFGEFAAVSAGQKAAPPIADLISSLPAFSWPS